jgi:hypothetical protein
MYASAGPDFGGVTDSLVGFGEELMRRGVWSGVGEGLLMRVAWFGEKLRGGGRQEEGNLG